TGALLGEVHARRLAGFFSELRAGIARECQRESPRIALLTPGRLNQSYPEQAHLARYLGLPLVEGRDLTVSDDRLYVRTIAGPKRIDALWRWIDTTALDPLHFDPRSEIGVPDLFDAWNRGGLEIANRPGVELLEAPAFAAVLPRLCRTLLGEAPLLSGPATWWCGEPGAAAEVRARFDSLALVPAFGTPVEGLRGSAPVPVGSLDDAARGALLAAMARRPMDYCGQELPRLSTTPALLEEGFVARPFTVRAFVARDSAGAWIVMPGGFARLAAAGDAGATLIGAGDLSADLCVVDPAPGGTPARTLLAATPVVRRGGGILASQAADNLFWFGRYMERTEATLRVVRALLGAGIEADGAGSGSGSETAQALRALLVEWEGLAERPDAAGTSAEAMAPEAARAVLAETRLPGGVPALFETLRTIGLTLRDRLPADFWRIAGRAVPAVEASRPGGLLRLARELLERLSALSGLLAENFVHGPAWRFLDMGRRLERGLALCGMVKALVGTEESPEALGLLLDLSDCQITYRSRYLAAPRRDPVLDLLLLDPDNPRSLAYQAGALADHVAALPALDDRQLPEAPLRQARALLAPMAAATAADFGLAEVAAAERALEALSDAISERFFLQFEKRESAGAAGGLLA
ncbi:MAG: circularly permuted type 2 ATP-grasp protein, partial [Sphingomonadales bacterium]|nr:circularly permuted type 2 ATP-grasp protein [Sphingomonadales bacterium]